ncbi:hypothetical protein DL89DRAFT_83875 [Linderina pennispora]|uniref:Uncharacterized protein n=1 Tax=Linderina pennispora TaxID=61395 RepID=A0A1Y1WH20_9FUNG|nr:uncharacterized protein DL89DRAFT_83875 [Linderina pennispora]ORX72861.1 hypothetical protein DL89DRAFT_83875 [Linderina pennispora]
MCQLAFSDESCEYLAQAFEQMQLQTQALASALSALFSVFLPDGVQQLDTLLLAFARQFCQRNCTYLSTPSEEGAEALQGSPPKKDDTSAKQVGMVYILACLAVIADYEVWQRQAKIGPDDLLKQYMPMAAKDTTTRAAFCEAFVEIQAFADCAGNHRGCLRPPWLDTVARTPGAPNWRAEPGHVHSNLASTASAARAGVRAHQRAAVGPERRYIRHADHRKPAAEVAAAAGPGRHAAVLAHCWAVQRRSNHSAGSQAGWSAWRGWTRTVVEWKHGEAARVIMQVAVEERAVLAPVWDQLAQLLASVGARLESHIVFDGEKPAGSPDSDKTLFSPIGDSSSFSSADGSKPAVHALVPPTYVEMASMESEPVGMPLARLLGYMDALARVASIEAQQQCMGSEAGSIKSGGSAVGVQKSHGSISTVGSCRSADSVERATRNVRKMFNILEALASDRSAFEWLAVWDHISQYIAGLGCPGRTSSNARALVISLAFGLVGHLARSPKFSVLQLQDRVLKVLVRIAKATRDLAVIQYIASELNTLVAKCLVCLGSGWTACIRHGVAHGPALHAVPGRTPGA